MAITSKESSVGKRVTIRVSGRFDFAAHQDVLRTYKQHPRGEKGFVVDLRDTEYLDSSAMGMLLQLRDYAAKEETIELVNGNDGVREILQIANFDKIFKVA